MKTKLYYYNLYIIGKKEPYYLTEEEGISLIQRIASGRRNKLLILNGGDLVVNLSAISHIFREVEKEKVINPVNGEIIGEKEVEIELTPKQMESRNSLKRLFKKGVPLLK